MGGESSLRQILNSDAWHPIVNILASIDRQLVVLDSSLSPSFYLWSLFGNIALTLGSLFQIRSPPFPSSTSLNNVPPLQRFISTVDLTNISSPCWTSGSSEPTLSPLPSHSFGIPSEKEVGELRFDTTGTTGSGVWIWALQR